MKYEKLTGAAQYALEALKNAGADKAAVAAFNGSTTEFNIDGGEFSLMRTIFNEGVGVTAYVGGRNGGASTNALDRESIDGAARDAVAAAQSAVPDDAWDISPACEPQDFPSGALECDRDAFFEAVKKLKNDIAAGWPNILIEQLVASYHYGASVKLNSNGVRFTGESGRYEVYLMFSAHDGDKSSSFFGSGVVFTDPTQPIIDMGSIRADLDAVSKQTDPKAFHGKFDGTLVLTPAMFGEFIGLAAENFASGGVIIEGTSPWKDKLGTQVADPRLNVRFAPLDPAIVGAERVTEDLFVSEDFDFIKDGVLQCFLLSLYASNKTGFDRAKNSSWALVVPAGDTPLEELVAGVDKGLLLGRFSGGQPGTNGDFSGVAKNSFLIENGKIKNAVTETMVNGNLGEIVKRVRFISSELCLDGGSVVPYIAVDGIVISGK
jgi:PmbA protein